MASQAERKCKTRQAILEAASSLISQNGYDATSVDDIAEAACVAKGTFYQHFETKLDVLLELTRLQQDLVLKRVVSAVEKGHAPLDAGRQFVRGMARWCREQGPVAGELVLRALERPDAEQQSSARNLLARILEEGQRRGEIRCDVSAGTLAIVIAGAMVPQMVYWSRHPEAGNIGNWLEQTWQLTLEGALPRKGAVR